MKREILFRGKRVDNGEWIEGFYTNRIPSLIKESSYIISEWEWTEVIPETTGQFTGLTDKNGVKIFEWDVVKDWAGIRVVKFEIYDNYQGYDLEPDDIDCEVIGNIHDNPELL